MYGNVFIFNNIENNKEDVELLYRTFGELNCVVHKVTNQPYDNLKEITNSIVSADYSNFKYIVIVILDNRNEDEHLWITTDRKAFHINGDLLNALCKNVHLKGKLRLSIIQNNRNFIDGEPILRRTYVCCPKYYAGKDLKYFATSTGMTLQHTWVNNSPSPFIKILCEELKQNLTIKLPIIDLLNRVSGRMEDEENELPSMETNFSESYVLENARIVSNSNSDTEENLSSNLLDSNILDEDTNIPNKRPKH